MSRQLSVETFETTNPLEAFDYAQAVIQVHADQEEGGPRSPTSRKLSAIALPWKLVRLAACWLVDQLAPACWLVDQLAPACWLVDQLAPACWLVDQLAPTCWLVDQLAPACWLVDQLAPACWLVDQLAPVCWLVDQLAPACWLVDQLAPACWLVDQLALARIVVVNDRQAPLYANRLAADILTYSSVLLGVCIHGVDYLFNLFELNIN